MKTNIRLLTVTFAVCLTFFAFDSTTFAQDNSESNSNSEAPTPAPVLTPIPIGSVVTEADAAAKRLENIKESLEKSPSINLIEAEVPKLKTELDSRITESTQLLSARPSLETLRTVEQDWKALSENVPNWKSELKAQITNLDTFLKEVTSLKDQWLKTQTLVSSASESSSNSNVLVESEQQNSNSANSNLTFTNSVVPQAVWDKIRMVLAEIEEVEKLIEKKRSRILTLQAKVGKEEVRINDILKSIKEYREEALTNLFVRDSPAIWNAQRSTDTVGGLVTEAGDSYWEQIGTLREYAARQTDRFFLHGLVLLLFLGILFWARNRLKPLVKTDAELEPAYSVFEMPFVGALILSIMLSGSLYPQAPRMLGALLGAAALVPGIIYLRKILEKPLFPILNALVVFYFIDLLRHVTAALPLLSRVLLVAEMVGIIAFLVWYLRAKRQDTDVEHQRIFVVTKKAIPWLLGFFTFALLANLIGYVGLSNVVGNSILGSAYIALILYATIQILKSLFIFALKVPPLSHLGMVKTHSPLIKAKAFKILKWLGIIFWGTLTLNLLSLRDTLFGLLRGWVTAELVIGSISISLGDVILFAITVWLSFKLSKLIRFVLEEDVYPRVTLGGGVPYAISTVLHYVLLIIGFVLAIAALGVDLTKFTILAGAFGVGLGFGMQNIVNNFVSGLILLFERPVKVNDVVQIGPHQGDLKRIGLRASVLRTLDGSEVIVPNGQLISEQVTNWTFSDQQRRLEINVGVAYGTDPRMVMEMLENVARENKEVLVLPGPRTVFIGFGESSLDFQLRAWTESDQWVVVRSDLTLAVHDALKEADIEIPFPQRDLHVRGIDAETLEKLKEDGS